MALTYDGSLGITFNDGSQLGSASQVGIRNRIINGNMAIDQRNAGASSTVTTSASYYSCDRWRVDVTQNSKLTVQQNAGSVTPPVGFTNYLGLTSTSAYSVGASDYFYIDQNIEGFNTADLQWGTANAKTVTLSFWVQSSLTGLFGGSLENAAGNRSYPFSYTITTANTWQLISITIAGDTTGTWVGATNGLGIRVQWGLGVGSSSSGTAGAWAATQYLSATGATSVVGTNGATFYITGVQLEKGSVATPFDFRPYNQELFMCQRYYWKVTSNGSNITGFGSGQFTGSTNCNLIFSYPATMRASPTMSYSGSLNVNGGSSGFAVSAIASTLCSPTYGRIDVTVSGATTGQGAAGWINTGGSDYVQASSEL
jgi:hypothetical protein